MQPAKERHALIGFTIVCFILWIVTSFGLMILWTVKGVPEPTAKATPALCHSYWKAYKEFIFSDAPAFGTGYLFLGLFMVRFLQSRGKD
jgi:hypothetical protein